MGSSDLDEPTFVNVEAPAPGRAHCHENEFSDCENSVPALVRRSDTEVLTQMACALPWLGMVLILSICDVWRARSRSRSRT